MIFNNIHADPADWRMGLFFAAEALDRAGLTLQASRLREARSPSEGSKEASAAELVCLGVSMVGHHVSDRLRAESKQADLPAWRKAQLQDWAFGWVLRGVRQRAHLLRRLRVLPQPGRQRPLRPPHLERCRRLVRGDRKR